MKISRVFRLTFFIITDDNENLDEKEKIDMFRDQDDSESVGNLLKLLYLNSLDGDPKPIFVLGKETENVKKIIQILYKRVGMPGDPPGNLVPQIKRVQAKKTREIK